jgi:hypothetical protein
LLRTQDVLRRGAVSGISGKLQIKALSWAPVDITKTNVLTEIPMRATKLEVILKWGGALTPLGEAQAQYLGETLRKSLYPDPKGGGVLRLHATFRHDLKIRTSDEGRVMQTAASFAKGLLQLEGPLTPILVSLVRKERGTLHMLDHAGNEVVKTALSKCKEDLHRCLHVKGALTKERLDELVPCHTASVRNALIKMKDPRIKLKQLHDAVKAFVKELDERLSAVQAEAEAALILEEKTKQVDPQQDSTSSSSSSPPPTFTSSLPGNDVIGLAPPPSPAPLELYMGETLLLLVHRWRKLHKDFHKPKKSDDFDLSKVPDILDAIRYDLEHNTEKLKVKPGTMEKVYRIAKQLGEAYIPQEYGMGARTKLLIGTRMCCELLKKIRNDLILGTEGRDTSGSSADMHYMLDTSHGDNLDVKSLGRHVRTRLYFTSETHLHTLLNVLRLGHMKFDGFPNEYDNEDLNAVIDDEGEKSISEEGELCYLTHIVIRVFEKLGMKQNDPARFRVELSFSPGANREPISMKNYKYDSDDDSDDDDENNKNKKPSSPSSFDRGWSKSSIDDDGWSEGRASPNNSFDGMLGLVNSSSSVGSTSASSISSLNSFNNSSTSSSSSSSSSSSPSSNDTTKSYFENNPQDALDDKSRLRVARTRPLNRTAPSTAAHLERFLEVAINIAESPITYFSTTTSSSSSMKESSPVSESASKKDEPKTKIEQNVQGLRISSNEMDNFKQKQESNQLISTDMSSSTASSTYPSNAFVTNTMRVIVIGSVVAVVAKLLVSKK